MLRESKLVAKNEGPFAVIDQDSEGSVRLRNLVDELLILHIDDYAGSVYWRSNGTMLRRRTLHSRKRSWQPRRETRKRLTRAVESGEHTGRWGVYKALGKSYRIRLDRTFPNGDYLCFFEDSSEARVPLKRITLEPRKLLRRGEKTSDMR